MFLTLKLMALAVCLFCAAIAAYLWSPAIGSFSGETLAYSVALEVGGGSAVDNGSCSRRTAQRWECDIWDNGGSGAARFHVRLSGHCWRATTRAADSTETRFPAHSHSCLKLHDQLRPVDRIFNHLL